MGEENNRRLKIRLGILLGVFFTFSLQKSYSQNDKDNLASILNVTDSEKEKGPKDEIAKSLEMDTLWKMLEDESQIFQNPEYLPLEVEKKTAEELEESKITCENLISGNLPAAADGRVNSVCNTAMNYCIAFESVKKSLRRPEKFLSPQMMRRLELYLEEHSNIWRFICQISRKAAQDPEFFNDYLMESSTDFSED